MKQKIKMKNKKSIKSKKNKKNKKIRITKNTKISDLINNYPEVGEFLLTKGLPCLGCPLLSIDRLIDICKIYNINWKEFKKEIEDFLKKKR